MQSPLVVAVLDAVQNPALLAYAAVTPAVVMAPAVSNPVNVA
jgi:hypothetical protein